MSSATNQILQPSPIWPSNSIRTQHGLERLALPLTQTPSSLWSPDSTSTLSLVSSPDTLIDPIDRSWSRLAKFKDLVSSTESNSDDTSASETTDHSVSSAEDTVESLTEFLDKFSLKSDQLREIATIPFPPSTPNITSPVNPVLLQAIQEDEDQPDWNQIFDPIHLSEAKPKLNPTATAFVPSRRSSLVPGVSRKSSLISEQDTELTPIGIKFNCIPEHPNIDIEPSEESYSASTGTTTTTKAPSVSSEPKPFVCDINASSQPTNSTKTREIPLFPPGLRPPKHARHRLWPAEDMGFFSAPFFDPSGQLYQPPMYLAMLESRVESVVVGSCCENKTGVVAQMIIDAMNYSCNFAVSQHDLYALAQALVIASTRHSVRAGQMISEDIPRDTVYTTKMASQQSVLADRFGKMTSLILGALVRCVGDKEAVDFGWRLCDALVHEFHRRWAAGAIIPDKDALNAGYDLCRSIAALRKYGILPQEHMQTCLRILLSNPTIESHAALVLLVVDAGVDGFVPRDWNKLKERMPQPGTADWEMMVGIYTRVCADMGWVMNQLATQGRKEWPHGGEIHETLLGIERDLYSTFIEMQDSNGL